MGNDKKKPINRTWQSIRAVLILLAVVTVVLFIAGESYGPWQMRGHAERAVAGSAPLQRRIEEFHARHKAFPDATAAPQFATKGDGRMWTGTEWDSASQALVVTLGGDYTFELTPKVGPTGVDWKCRARRAPADYTPRICRDELSLGGGESIAA